MELEARSRRPMPQIDPDLECLPHLRKARGGCEPDLGILATRLKGDICGGGLDP